MKEHRKEKKEEKRVYEKPALTRHGKLGDMTGAAVYKVVYDPTDD